jgi:hypothetical protein
MRLPHDSLPGSIIAGFTLTVVLFLVIKMLISGS